MDEDNVKVEVEVVAVVEEEEDGTKNRTGSAGSRRRLRFTGTGGRGGGGAAAAGRKETRTLLAPILLSVSYTTERSSDRLSYIQALQECWSFSLVTALADISRC